MTIQECYRAMGGDYEQAVKRLSSEAMVRHFIGRFLEDGSYQQLCTAMKEKNRKMAYCAAQTLESVSGNLSFLRLFRSAYALTEALRLENDVIPESAGQLMKQVEQDYASTAAAIRLYLEGTE